jgi:hypothetical protein
MDGWVKTTSLDIWRQHNDATLTKDGSFYSLKTTTADVSQYVYTPPTLTERCWQTFAGRTVVFGCWAKTDTASHVRLRISDGATNTFSSYHTGGNTWEWLEVTVACAAGATTVGFNTLITFDVSAKTAYISQPMLAFGSYLGSGNYQPIPNEVILSESSTMYFAPSETASFTVNLEARFSGKVPKGIKGIHANLYYQNSGIGVLISLKNASTGLFHLSGYSQVANIRMAMSGSVLCDSNGDVYLYMGDANFSNLNFTISGVIV